MSIKRYVEREHSRKKSLQTQMELLETLPQEGFLQGFLLKDPLGGLL